MNKEQITFLMNAGYSIEEIMSMTMNPEPAPTPEPNPEPTPTPEPNPKPSPDMLSQIAALTGAVDNLTQLVQRGNIGGISFGNPPQERTAHDVLAEIINPPQKK